MDSGDNADSGLRTECRETRARPRRRLLDSRTDEGETPRRNVRGRGKRLGRSAAVRSHLPVNAIDDLVEGLPVAPSNHWHAYERRSVVKRLIAILLGVVLTLLLAPAASADKPVREF